MMRKCKERNCKIIISGGEGLPAYCPDHNEKNLAAVSLGKIKSEKKAEAARANGKKGGRPKKLKPH